VSKLLSAGILNLRRHEDHSIIPIKYDKVKSSHKSFSIKHGQLNSINALDGIGRKITLDL